MFQNWGKFPKKFPKNSFKSFKSYSCFQILVFVICVWSRYANITFPFVHWLLLSSKTQRNEYSLIYLLNWPFMTFPAKIDNSFSVRPIFNRRFTLLKSRLFQWVFEIFKASSDCSLFLPLLLHPLVFCLVRLYSFTTTFNCQAVIPLLSAASRISATFAKLNLSVGVISAQLDFTCLTIWVDLFRHFEF